MAVSVGGITLEYGMNFTKLVGGLKHVESKLLQFDQKMNSVKTAGFIKGDLFKEQTNYINQSKTALDSMFKTWSKNIQITNKSMSKFGERARKEVTSVIKSYETAANKLSQLKTMGNIGRKSVGLKGLKGDALFENISSKNSVFGKTMQDLKGMSVATDEIISKMEARIKKGFNAGTAGLIVSKFFREIKAAAKLGSDGVIKEYEKVGIAFKRAYKLQNQAGYMEELRQAKSTTKALEDRRTTMRKLKIEEESLRTQMKLNINVEANRAKLIKNLQARQALGISLNRRQTAELKKHDAALEAHNKKMKQAADAAKKAQAANNAFLSPGWIRSRLKWFFELRVLWELYRGLTETLRDVVSFHEQLARAMRTASKEQSKLAKETKQFTDEMLIARAKYGASYEDIGETLYQLGSAGLKAEESLAGLNTSMKLQVGLEGTARDTTKLVAALYNNYKDSIDGATTATEKFNVIGNTLATTWRKHQIEFDEMNQALKHSIAPAKAVGINFTQLNAILGVSHDRLIRAGQAGRMLATVWAKISREPRRFMKAFNLEGEMDPNKPLEFMRIMNILNSRIKGNALTISELGTVYERLGLRSVKLFLTLVENWDQVNKSLTDYKDGFNNLDDVTERRLNNINSQWKRFTGSFSAFFVDFTDGLVGDLAKVFKFWSDQLENAIKKMRDVRNNGADAVLNDIENSKYVMFGEVQVGKNISTKSPMVKDLNKKDLDNMKSLVTRLEYALANEVRFNQRERLKKAWSFFSANVKFLEKYNNVVQHAADPIGYDEDYGKSTGMVDYKALEDRLKTQKDILTEQVKAKKSEADLAKKRGYGETERKKLKEYYDLQVKLMNVEEDISNINSGASEEAQKLRRENKKRALAQAYLNNLQRSYNTELTKSNTTFQNNLKAKEQITAFHIKLIKEEEKQALSAIGRQKILNSINKPEDRMAAFRLSEDELDMKEYYLKLQYEAEKNSEKQKAILEDLRRVEEDRLQLNENIKRATDGIYDAYKRLKGQMKDFNQMMSDVVYGGATTASSGLGNIFQDATGGFQESQQEVANLKGELSGLAAERDQLIAKGLLDEDEVNRLQEINAEMQSLRDNIDDLEDPIENLKDSFRSFAKGVIDEMRNIINQWIAMQIVMGIFKGVTGAFSGGNAAANVAPADTATTTFVATGGVIPNIKSFRAFSKGGMTGRPTLAVLGDNRSGKEIVIPEENIKSDSVSGYARDKKEENAVYILNVLTPEDIAGAMSSPEGGRVIVNQVLKHKTNMGWQGV